MLETEVTLTDKVPAPVELTKSCEQLGDRSKTREKEKRKRREWKGRGKNKIEGK